MKKITVVGTGYVGLVTGVALAEIGHHVVCLDKDAEKVELMCSGISPIYEAGLEGYLAHHLRTERLEFTTDASVALDGAELVFIAVGTPQLEDGSADLSYLREACLSVAESLSGPATIVIKSTVPVGTNDLMEHLINEHTLYPISVVSNPEFLREGQALYDTFQAERIVIGSEDKAAGELLQEVYAPLARPVFHTDRRSAELIKYASNAFLATKISFINEMAALCDELGANVDDVAWGMGMDTRIGHSFLKAGAGYGGSCFPKDTKALVQIAKEARHDFKLMKTVIDINDFQRHRILKWMKDHYPDMRGLRIAVLGLSFKPNTDDIREAPSLILIEALIECGADIVAYDPAAIPNAKKVLGERICYAYSVEEAIEKADGCLIVTEWNEIKETPIEVYHYLMEQAVVFDGRNCYSLEDAKRAGVTYYSVGRPCIHDEQFIH
ncbi:UDP-glucose dehydrogenase family protein [Alkalihalophilus marmarensis]|uniref:UDP-glucose dehydrogenase family protein n=1 Tax=Alkalihalophilus marmarensis TaxID=521377 RepID=UPI002DB5CC3F|nr:UDP-glucose/GDP-mannose dehydrogenase family protein [Alkalihalophilus marmarensis]MEC2071318.1 UDP-glucose/GDP-mannose dehydrogenase family protein [Alkalihalophilus marmarensis]